MAATVSRVRGRPPPIDTGWAWMVCLGFFLYVFFMVGLAKSFGLILVALIREFGISTATATLPISVTLFVYAFGAPLAILIGEWCSIQKVVVIGAVIGFAGIALSSLLYNIVYFILTFGLFYGIGNSCFYGNGMIMIGTYFKHHRSLANGLALSGASIGQFALPPLIEYLLDNYGLQQSLLLIGSFYLHGAISGFLFRPIGQYDPVEDKAPSPVRDEEEPMIQDSGYKPDGHKTDNENGHGYSCYDEKKILLSSKEGKGQDPDGMMKGDGNVLEGSKMAEFSPDVEKNNENDLNDEDDLNNETKLILGSQGSIFMVSGNSSEITNRKSTPPPSTINETTQSSPSCGKVFFKIIDFSLLRNYVTIFFTVVSFLCFFGYFNFVLYLPAIVLEKGIKDNHKAWLVSIGGIGDLIARISVGFFADLNLIARYKIKAIACLLCSANIFMFVFADSFAWLAVHCFLYGFLGGAYVCMIAVVLVDLVGLTKMGPNLAVVLFIQGIGSSAGNPVLGFLKDQTGSFAVVSITCAFAMGFGAIILFCYPLVRRLESKRNERA